MFSPKRILYVLVVLFGVSFHMGAQNSVISFDNDNNNRKIDVLIDGRLFTSLRYSSDYEKPFLYPIYSPEGAVITRGYPLEPRMGERVDHPHQIGLWFNYGDVNGLDFWNNSSAVHNKEKYGHIVVTNIVVTSENVIEVTAEWRDHKESVLLEEKTRYIFDATKNTRIIDRESILKAIQNVQFGDNKEGLIAIRVDRFFEALENVIPSGNTGVGGLYYSSEGYEGDAVWSTRNDWVLLAGQKNGERITFGFFDHPQNIGYPFHAHARGYGLFAVNNLGAQSYNQAEETMRTCVSKGDSLIFIHRFYMESGRKVTKEKANVIFKEFSDLFGK